MIKAFLFDAFGTLFNLDQSLLANLSIAEKDALAYAREKQLSYTWLHSLMEKYIPFDEITRIALQDGCRKMGLTESKAEQLGQLYFQPTCFPDVLPALQQLKAQGIKTAILSNGTPDMLKSGAAKNYIDELLSQLISIDEIKIYKPSPQVYQHAIQKLGFEKNEVGFVSSNQWDAMGARQFGLPTYWLNRAGVFREGVNGAKEIAALSDLVNELKAAR